MARIMVVEDESIVAQDLAAILVDLGHEVTAVVGSGDAAVERARETQPGLVLMDVRLRGDMDGVEAARRIRQTLDVPIVFLTAYADGDSVNRAKQVEPFGYVLKPYSDREMRGAIEVALHKHAMEVRLKEREQWFSVTLRSIGDGVIAADPQGHVTFLNPVAERLTGWPQEEATGRPLAEVFQVLDEATRQPTSSPAVKALEERVVTSPEATPLLISRHGTELYIDACASPITDAGGQAGGRGAGVPGCHGKTSAGGAARHCGPVGRAEHAGRRNRARHQQSPGMLGCQPGMGAG